MFIKLHLTDRDGKRGELLDLWPVIKFKEFCALLSLRFPGGRGKDGAPIITFPECLAFSEVPDEDFLNVLTYLTSIPR